MAYEPVIGLEIHVQLRTATKLFCGCAAAAGGPPNTRTCPVCLGLPGALPVVNQAAVDQALTAALVLGCRIEPVSVFARKNYFYPDLPKGYQITQFEEPLAVDGRLAWNRHGRSCEVGILRVHLEEDAGKSLHEGFAGADCLTGLDYNRSGVPLAEVVTRPDLRTAADAAECFRQLRTLLVEAGVTDGNLEEGNLRCDANVSLRDAGVERLGQKTEIKNLNSFRFLERALEFEIDRQTSVLARGGTIETATLQWDERADAAVPMRGKEDAGEYRYFPEPDLPPLTITPERELARKAALPESPAARLARLRAAYGLGEEDAAVLAASAPLAAYFERVAAGSDSASAQRWVSGELLRRIRETGGSVERVALPPEALARLIGLVAGKTLSLSAAKQVFGRMFETGESPEAAIEALGLSMVSDPAVLRGWVEDALAGYPAAVVQYREGRRGALGFLVGQVMKASGGCANPQLVDEILRDALDGRVHP